MQVFTVFIKMPAIWVKKSDQKKTKGVSVWSQWLQILPCLCKMSGCILVDHTIQYFVLLTCLIFHCLCLCKGLIQSEETANKIIVVAKKLLIIRLMENY